jgi:hypothetical protein
MIKAVIVSALGGLVAIIVYKTWGTPASGAPQTPSAKLGFNDPRYTGEIVGVNKYNPALVPSGHGDATLNAGVGSTIMSPGQDGSTVSDPTVYKPAFGTTNDCGPEWPGVGVL